MRRLAPLCAALPLSLVVPAAHAETGRVTVSYAVHAVRLDNGQDVMAAFCEATADPGTTGHVATQTGVSCGIDGAGVTLTYPGGKALATIASLPDEAHQLCYSARAGFFDGDSVYFVASTPTCVTL